MDSQTESNGDTIPENKELREAVEKVEFPEGGISGWSTVVGASVLFSLTISSTYLAVHRFLVQFCGFGYEGTELSMTSNSV
jgi:hypothetical protein